ncbi:MAG TPA: hypothetical protein VLD67_05370 [Vicinamibacterales bacterium]|nr:hypothetical protein [Vicinamibacterales bacterium]
MNLDEVMHTRWLPPPSVEPWRRWIDVFTAAAGVRYRAVARGEERAGAVQTTVGLRARLKLDRNGHYSVHTGTGSGRGFLSGWDSTGLGAGQPAYRIAMRELFASIRPAPAVQIEVGGLYLSRGESTEATTYDNNGYIVGERLVIGSAARYAISLTRAYLGDLENPDVIPRLRRLDRANYLQAQLTTRPARRVMLSADYTRHLDSDVLRAAMVLDSVPTRVVDRIRFENYLRLHPTRAYGYAAMAQQRLSPRLSVGLGMSQIDSGFGGLNSDRYATGRRVFASFSFEARPGWIVSSQFIRALGGTFTGPQTRVEIGVAYDALKAMKH